ncbi:MAG: DUF4365 domain-containing protein [Candidatus Methanoperedens sp.]|nr:DUF4365 domain-containing protein [Candidatus Methanoperedens sp.]
MPAFPQRPRTHTLDTQSETYFRGKLPVDWIVSRPANDYGQDLIIEIAEDGQMRGLGLTVQIKSSENPSRNVDYESIDLKTSTYNYLRNNLFVVLLIKYVSSENEAYWLLLKDVNPPENEGQNSFTVKIPKRNKLSELDWNIIVDYVRTTTNIKLESVPNRIQNNNNAR